MQWLTLLAACHVAYGAEKFIRLDMQRETVEAVQPRQTGDLASQRLKSLYWSTLVNVGDGQNLRLTIDTGSTDVILNKGYYKPSKNRKPYPKKGRTLQAGFEGVNRAGYGFVNLTGTVQYDTVSIGKYSVKQQAVGAITSYKLSDTHHLPNAIPGDGVIGFAGYHDSQFRPQDGSWLENVYEQGDLDEDRFGLAFGTSGKGQTIIGTYDDSLVAEPIFPIQQQDPNGTYLLNGDVYLNGDRVLKNQHFIMDVGTTNIQAPLGQAHEIFKELGYQTSITNDKNINVKILNAYFDCNKPPTLGFGFEAADGSDYRVFSVPDASWDLYNHGNNNCTSVLGGTNGVSSTKDAYWLLGQAFMVSHYMDFNNGGKTIGIAHLKNPAM